MDGLCGTSVAVLINPALQTITNVVVQTEGFPSTSYLVPLQEITKTSPDRIQLRCTRAALQQMPAFLETEFALTPEEEDTVEVWPHAIPDHMRIAIEHEQVPPGELVVRRGALVEATDGAIGKLGGFLLDPETNRMTHLILLEGVLQGKREMTLPVSAIDHIAPDTLSLKLDKQAIESLPALPRKHFYHWSDEAVQTIDLIVMAFATIDRASEAARRLRQLHQGGVLEILNVATLVKDASGKIILKEKEDVAASHGALFGAITGGIVGLLGGPVGAVVGAVAGAAAGGIAAHWIDMGFSDEMLLALQQALTPNSSAVVVLVEHSWVDKALAVLAELEGQRLQQTLTDDMVYQLIARLEEKGTNTPLV